MPTNIVEQNSDWKALRVFHLVGGCRAVNGFGPSVEFHPQVSGGRTATFNIESYQTIYRNLDTLGAMVIGIDYVSHTMEAAGVMPPDWRSYPQTIAISGTSCEEVAQRWAQIGHGAFKCQRGKLWDLARRIAHQMRVCSWRLRQLSESYRESLHARVRRADVEPGMRFSDGFSELGYLTLQTFLVDACILRDYLSEFYAEFLQETNGDRVENITSIGGLKRRILAKTKRTDDLTKELQAATEPDGWLHTLGAYRDLVVHAAPLGHADGRLFAVAETLRLCGVEPIPCVRLPLPRNPTAVSKKRATQEQFSDFKTQWEAFLGASRDESNDTDGLQYAHSTLHQLVALARTMSEQSPVAPEMMRFDSSNIIGDIRQHHFRLRS